MKKGLFLMAALILISGASMAQRVVTVDGKAIIDNRDMPAKAITTEKKAQTTDGTNSTSVTNGLTDLGSAESNKTVSHYFEVMKTDLNNGTRTDWLSAIQGCANYDSGDGKKEWRLPTQRELQLIWTLHESLKKKAADFVSFYPNGYWSATEFNTSSSWHVDFSSGDTYIDYHRYYAFRVRCVRDLTPPAK